ncbi:hypothetical protein LOTGIDRAFT_238228 [Lottia gigantea]|uniref:Uncharacterized protein n=1 Tax=Lottia gigantea TaxID=225164 RepID=V4B686_LOTGI|nr:hypothetical protein LOTGIDRAFT_238228 [Lottia gigantea]ESP01612.1 hypothetical protein LOTGIDRAFT_238228 [Lottia gigantea]
MMGINELENLKYHELQKLAKAKGIRANMKVEKLRKALKDHYESDASNTATDHGSSSSSTEQESKKQNSPKIKKSRGRKDGRKKKDIDTSNDEDTSNETKTNEEEQAVRQTRNRKTRKSKKSKKGEVELKSPVPKKPVIASIIKSPFASIKSPAVRRSTTILGVKSLKSTPTTFKSPVWAKKQPIQSPALNNKALKKQLAPKRKRSNSKEEKKENVEQPVNVEPSAKRVRKNSSPPKVNTPTRTSLTKSSPLNNTPKNNTPKQGKRKSSSPGVKSMLQAMDGLSSEQMKATLLEALDKKVAENPGTSSQVSNIPRFTAFVGQNGEKADKKKANTPDWKKIHKKEFSRWDNLETYMEKRKKRAEGLTGSFNSVHKLLKETQTAVDRLKNTKTPQIVKPVRKDSIRSSFQSPKGFKPSTISTKNLNLKFGANKTPVVQSNNKTPRSTSKPTPVTPVVRTVSNTSSGVKSTKSSKTPKSNISKRSVSRQSTTKPKSPASQQSTSKPKSPASQQSTAKPKSPASRHSTAKPRTPAETLVKPRINIKPSSTVKSSPHFNSLTNITHKSNKLSIGDGFITGGTPLKFKGLNTSVLNSSMKKPSFDLKASLSRPMTWKAHKGKLKPLDLNTAYKTLDKTSYKTPQTQTIKDRRRKVEVNRADKKFESQMRKRGLSLA